MLSVITPTYNEAENIRDLISQIHSALREMDYELIVIDDNSPDGTGQIADELLNKYPLKVIHRSKRLGLASAVTEGFKVSRGDLVCVIDSDLSHPPEIIPKLIECLNVRNTDIVVASRYIKDGGAEGCLETRKAVSFLAALSTKPLTKIKDSMSGFFLFKREVINNAKLVPRGYKILLEILVKGTYKRVVEFPFVFMNRTRGSSKLNLKICLEYFIQLIYLYAYKLKTVNCFEKLNINKAQPVRARTKKGLGSSG